MSNRSFYLCVSSFFFGVFLLSFADILYAVLFVSLIVAACSICLFGRDKQRSLSAVFIVVFSFSCGAIRMEISKTDGNARDENIGRTVEMVGMICDEPVEKDMTQRFCFSPEDSLDRVLITASRYPLFGYGDILKIRGRLDLPENFESYPGGPQFDYVSHLAKDGIRYTMLRPDIALTGENRGNLIRMALYDMKAALISRIERLFPEPESSVLTGMLLGDRSSMPKDVRDDFAASGLIHILVLSGYNVTVVADTIMKVCAFLPRALGQTFGALSIVAFAIMTGAGATTVRASIMAIVVVGSRFVRRRYDVSRALLIAALCMVMYNPAILAFDVSFQLSFLATIAVVYVTPIASSMLGFITEKWNIREIVATTVGTQVFLFPFLVYIMGQISLVSFITNIFALPVVPYAMFGGFLASAGAFISDVAAFPVAWATSAVLSYLLFIAHVSARLPFAAIHMKTSAFALAVVYSFYCWYIVRATISLRRKNYFQQSAN